MLTILSSSKTQRNILLPGVSHHQPVLLDKTALLLDTLAHLDRQELQSLLGVSEKLARTTGERYRRISLPHAPATAGHVLASFGGTVFSMMELNRYTAEDLQFADGHLRILSGLYGLLRPLDLMQPYRLEMGTKLVVGQASQLYEFWQEAVTDELSRALADHSDQVLVNCASREYARVVDPKRLAGRIITLSFKQRQNNVVKTVAVYAKRARGLFVDWLITNQIDRVAELTAFDRAGYRLSANESKGDELVFITDSP
ncbi:MAG: YaaA family protein [Desulfofustis sp.]|nr:YaaA family protein [Desulfofustis sp.]